MGGRRAVTVVAGAVGLGLQAAEGGEEQRAAVEAVLALVAAGAQGSRGPQLAHRALAGDDLEVLQHDLLAVLEVDAVGALARLDRVGGLDGEGHHHGGARDVLCLEGHGLAVQRRAVDGAGALARALRKVGGVAAPQVHLVHELHALVVVAGGHHHRAHGDLGRRPGDAPGDCLARPGGGETAGAAVRAI